MNTSGARIAIALIALMAPISPLRAEYFDCDPALKEANGGKCPVLAGGTGSGADDKFPDQFYPTAYSSSTCPYVRLDSPGRLRGDKVNGDITPMAHVGVLDQDGLGLCYSYVASELTDAWRFSHGETNYDFRTSPLYTAVGDERRRAGDSFWAGHSLSSARDAEGGHIKNALNWTRDLDICDARAVVDHSDVVDVAKTIDLLEKYFNSYKEYKKSQIRLSNPYLDPVMLDLLAENPDSDTLYSGMRGTVAAGLRACLLSEHIAPSIIPSTEALTEILTRRRAGDFVFAFLFQECLSPPNGERVLSMPAPTTWGGVHTDSDDFEEKFNKLLDKPRPQPVGISYCAGVLTQGKDFSGLHRDRYVRSAYKDACGNHASAVIGRRYNPTTKSCEFLVQNSWGKGCGWASKDWECKGGKVWLDSKSLSKNVYELTYLED